MMAVQTVQQDEAGMLEFLFSPNVDGKYRLDWMAQNFHVCACISGVYILLVYLVQNFMKTRQPFDLRRWMALWNFFLAIFSVWCLIGLTQEMGQHMIKGGFHNTSCHVFKKESSRAIYLGWLFMLSKVVELGDTFFLLLRKRPLVFLHWFHHSTVLMYCWYSMGAQVSMTTWFTSINLLVHSMMYTYFGFAGMGYKIPRGIAQSITLVQISQMVVGVWVTVYVYTRNLKGIPCDSPNSLVYWGLAMYATYLILFGQFYIRAYMTKKPSGSQGNKTD